MTKTGKMRMHRALPLHVTAQVSPSKAEDSNYQVKKELRKELAQMGSNIQLTERHEMRAISRIRRGHIECLGEVEIENDYGELFAWLEAHKYSALRQLPACDFDPYYAWVLCYGWLCVQQSKGGDLLSDGFCAWNTQRLQAASIWIPEHVLCGLDPQACSTRAQCVCIWH